MRNLTMSTLACVVLASASCSPAYNWRDVAIEPGSLVGMLPCKPDTQSRPVQVSGASFEISMRHCAVESVTAAIGFARTPQGLATGTMLQQWRMATLAGIAAQVDAQADWSPRNPLAGVPAGVRLRAHGRDSAGKPVQLQAAWFAGRDGAYAALIYGAAVPEEVADTFFAGMRFR